MCTSSEHTVMINYKIKKFMWILFSLKYVILVRNSILPAASINQSNTDIFLWRHILYHYLSKVTFQPKVSSDMWLLREFKTQQKQVRLTQQLIASLYVLFLRGDGETMEESFSWGGRDQVNTERNRERRYKEKQSCFIKSQGIVLFYSYLKLYNANEYYIP